MKGIFVTGTDTGVGKTVVTATLCRILRERGLDAVALKPFATGIGPDTDWRDNDPLLLAAAMDYAEQPEVISPVRLSPALSPYDAARLGGITLDLDAVWDAIHQVAARHAFALIEGVGGVYVPLTKDVTVADFAKRLNLPALVVARSGIGTINHSLLTVETLRQTRVGIEGLIFSRASDGELSLDERLGTETACLLAKVPCFGLIPRSRHLAAASSPDEFARALPTHDPALNALADCLVTTGFA